MLTSGEVDAKKWLQEQPQFMSKIYALIKKIDKRGKTTAKAFEALYCSEDLEVPGAIRVIPYTEEGDSVTSHPTEVVLSYKLSKEMPLLKMGEVVGR